MPSLTKITSSMFPDLYEALLREWNPRLGEDGWRRGFETSSSGAEDGAGYVLTDGGKVVGVLGMIFSERRFGERTARFCNLHSWHVKPAYRLRSLSMLRPALELKDHTLTDMTPTDGVIAVMKRLGFSTLDRLATVLLPLPWRERGEQAAIEELTGPAEQQRVRLNAADLQIYKDHQDIDCGHTLVRTSEGYCYIVYSRMDQHWLPHCFLHYISDKRIFAEHHASIRRHLMRASGRQFVVVDTRLLAHLHVPGAVRVRATEKLYRSSDTVPHEIDSLYSELAFYKHSALPPLRQRLRVMVRDCTTEPVRRFLGATR